MRARLLRVEEQAILPDEVEVSPELGLGLVPL